MEIEERKKTDAVRILHERYIKGKPREAKLLERELEKIEVAQRIYQLRTEAGFTQADLARRVGTRQSVISRLEDADYRGHSLRMLERVAEALDCRVQIGFVPNGVHATQKG